MSLPPSQTVAKKPLFPLGIPLAEMHVHISLALVQRLYFQRLAEGRITSDKDFTRDKGQRYYPDLTAFHNTYEAARGLTATPEELRIVTQGYLEYIAAEGCVYAEISNSYRAGDAFTAQMEALEQAIDEARATSGIEARIMVTTLRNAGYEQAEEAATALVKAAQKHRYITGFGLVGDESVDSLLTYRRALDIAWNDAGLGISPHVGEQLVQNAVDFLDIIPAGALDVKEGDMRRIRGGHGILIHTSSELMDEYAQKGICLELPISAHKRIGIPAQTRGLRIGDTVTGQSGKSYTLDQPLRLYYNRIEDHPLTQLHARGIKLCLGSDNPLLMNTSIGKEYSLAILAGFPRAADVIEFTLNALRSANLDQVTRKRLITRVEAQKQAFAPVAQASVPEIPDGPA